MRASNLVQNHFREDGCIDPRSFRESEESVADCIIRQHTGIDTDSVVG